MAWGAIGAALLGGGVSALSAKKKNKNRPQVPDFQPYSGYKPPHTSFLRPVEKQITDIVMQRSRGEDVGYDPARREALLENFKIQQDRDLRDSSADIKNRLSGMGLSRNVAANDDLLGRALRHSNEEKNLYTNRVDIEDLARRNEERDTNTGRLQNLNTFNFGQENKVADFDLDVYGQENQARNQNYAQQSNRFDQYEDPWASALESGANMGFGVAGMGMGGSKATPVYDPTMSSAGGGYRKDINNNYYAQALAQKTGKNFYQ